MNNDLIFFNSEDTLKEKATKTALIYSGSVSLKKELEKLGVNYTKVQRGGSVIYVLRHKSWGRCEVKL